MCGGKFFLRHVHLIPLGIGGKIRDPNQFCVGDHSGFFHEVAGLTCSDLTISWARRTRSSGWVIVPLSVIVERKNNSSYNRGHQGLYGCNCSQAEATLYLFIIVRILLYCSFRINKSKTPSMVLLLSLLQGCAVLKVKSAGKRRQN